METQDSTATKTRAIRAEAAVRAQPAQRGDPLLAPLTSLPGVGPARAAAFEKLGVRCVRDLLFLLPRRLEQSGARRPISEAAHARGDEVRVAGKIERVSLQRFGRRVTLRVTIADETGSIVALFFNQPWLRKSFTIGASVELAGRVVDSRGPALASPKIGTSAKPLSAPGTFVTSYPLAEGLGQELVRRLVVSAAREHAAKIDEHLPLDVLGKLALPPLSRAIAEVHAPSTGADFTAARRRLALEPLMKLQARLHARRQQRDKGRALAVDVSEQKHAELVARFPFTLTRGQSAVIADLRSDLSRTVPMRRLLQGDVGSGKTALGVYACMAIAAAGGQSAFLAPTELLAEQHFDGLRPLLARAGLHGVLLTGSLAAAERRQVLAQLESGMADVAFGTHALFSADVKYRKLALCIIDEQHRFGVAQRAELLEKGLDVHALLMTATPIPRTLALTLYGDLETSLLADRPPGRGALKTRWVRGHDRKRVPPFLRERLAAGEQVFWVSPRIGAADDDEEDGRASAERAFDQLTKSPLAEFGIELVHGRLAAAERAQRLERFRRGDARLLVATTVIEVGVDVPGATVMVIENAERLGLAQLHQLRGRIGRGAKDAWCLLFGKPSASERFLLLEKTTDGFEIAEEDLKRRGMGDLAGLRQAGENAEGLSDLEADLDLFFAARDLVRDRRELFDAYRERATPITP